ncbi:hypothetical protein [Chitinophaga sp. MM2321]|uniref:hypothetical protein n=1 Tax=Chitinophaga sp. MM2321 TaxID=3137178 RepID=UPI0032D5AFE0
MSDKMMVTGYTADNQGYLEDTTEPLDYHMPFTSENTTFGMPVTVKAYFGMLLNFYKLLSENPDAQKVFQDVHSVEFSKASLFRLLSQQGCEYIRFYFAVPEVDQKLSLLAEGLDIDRNQIGYAQLMAKAQANDMVHDSTNPLIEERGNGGGKKPPLTALLASLQESGYTQDNISLTNILAFLNDTSR